VAVVEPVGGVRPATAEHQDKPSTWLTHRQKAKAVRRDREIHEWLTAARDADLPVITSAAVLVEVIHPKINDAALKWTLSRLSVEPVTQTVAQSAAALLRAAGLHGHKYAIDATA
jgi:hypothetical protein